MVRLALVSCHRSGGDGPKVLSKRVRTIVLFVVLAVVVGNITFAVLSHRSVPEALYAILGTIGGYVMLGRGGGGDTGDGKPEGEPKHE